MIGTRSFDQLVQDPIFVVGAARSGTTWVEDILGAHPLVAAVHESFLFTENSEVGALLCARGRSRSSRAGKRMPRTEAIIAARDFAMRILQEKIGPGHRFLVEKSPAHLYAMPLIAAVFPGARFIHVVRDGRDVTVSVQAAASSWEPGWKKTFGRSVAASARTWKDAVRVSRRYGVRLGGQFFEVRYESIHADPFGAYRRIFDFCGIPYDEDLLQKVFEATDFADNYETDEQGFRRGGRVGDWRARFDVADALCFNAFAGDTLIALGYEKSRFWGPLSLRRRHRRGPRPISIDP